MLTTFLVWTALASVITATLFILDKRAAAKDQRRVSEKTLLAWSIAGGWPGGMIASRIVRHKTQKLSFRIQFALCIIIHLAVVGWLCWRKM